MKRAWKFFRNAARNARRPAIAAAVFFLAAGLIGAALYKISKGSGPVPVAIAQGFTPGTRIDYEISEPLLPSIKGSARVDEQGRARIEDARLKEPNAFATCRLSVFEPGRKDPLEISVSQDLSSRALKVSTKGLSDFETIGFGAQTASKKAKADWSGSIATELPWTPTDQNLEVAFYNDPGVISDAPADPKMIRVFQAPGGGGGPVGNGGRAIGLNAYYNLFCENVGGIMLPSTCQPETLGPTYIENGPGSTPMQRQIFNIMDNYIRALMMMGEQLTAVMMHQMLIVGTFLDAKFQLETQREFQRLIAKAHKDYHPSELMCRIGTFMRSVPRTDQKMTLNKTAMNKLLMSEYENVGNMATAEGYSTDMEARIRQFRKTYCDPADNNNGLAYMCEHDQDQNLNNSIQGAAAPRGIGAPNAAKVRMNKDIDYARTLDKPLTVDIDFADENRTDDEEDILSLARNLYWPRAMDTSDIQQLAKKYPKYMDARHIFAALNVAHNSFTHIASMKARAEPGKGPEAGWNYMKSMMRNFGLSDAEIHKLLGDYPSYWAQMEVLTKKMYQYPDYYTDLIDKPVNVNRISASLEAIKVMQQRDMLESLQRREMLDSLLVEEELIPRAAAISGQAAAAVKSMKP